MDSKRANNANVLPMSPEEKRFLNNAKRLKLDDSCEAYRNKRGLGCNPPLTKSKLSENVQNSVEFPSYSGSVKTMRKYVQADRRVFFASTGTHPSFKGEPMEVPTERRVFFTHPSSKSEGEPMEVEEF